MKKVIRSILWLVLGFCIGLFMFMPVVRAENWIPDYGYYENSNEIKAKDEVKNDLNTIFDYENSSNEGGERITNGHYYVDVKYKGGYNGTDTDHVYLDDIIGKDGVDGKDGLNGLNGEQGVKGDTGLTGDVGEKGDKGDKGDQGEKGLDGKDLTPDLKKGLSVNDARADELNNRIAELERPQFIIGAVFRHYDTRKWQVNTFVDVSTTRGNLDRAGIRFTYKIGKSYEETRIDELQARLDKAEGINEVKEQENNREMYQTSTGVGIKSKF